MKSSRWNGRSFATAARRVAGSGAMIISRTIAIRSGAKNMCSVRTRPMPSAPNSRAFAASAGVSAFARTPSDRRSSAQPRNSLKALLSSGWIVSTASSSTSPVLPSTEMTSPSRTFTPPASNSRRSSSTRTSEAPTMQGLPMPTATTAACDVRPPRAVRMPSAAYIPAMSSGEVSGRTRMTLWPAFARSTAVSASNTTCPTAAPGAAGSPRASRRFCAIARSLSFSSKRGWSTWLRSAGRTRMSAVSRSRTCSWTRSTATRTAASAERLPARVCRR